MRAEREGPPGKERPGGDQAARPNQQITKHTPNQAKDTTPRYRSGLRAIHMIHAAKHCDYERFGRPYADAEAHGEAERKWTLLQIASACASYITSADMQKILFHAIEANYAEVDNTEVDR
jgi:hypothetical protein